MSTETLQILERSYIKEHEVDLDSVFDTNIRDVWQWILKDFLSWQDRI